MDLTEHISINIRIFASFCLVLHNRHGTKFTWVQTIVLFFFCHFMHHYASALIKILLKWTCHLCMNWFNMTLLCNHASCNIFWSTWIDALTTPTSLLLCVLFAKLFPHKIHIRAPSREIHSVENILSSTGIEGPFEEYNKFVKITCL